MNKQQGNVLFLILIAVALFAALSYAITRSSRGGGGDASSEKASLLAAQILQYGSGMQNAILRMRITNGCNENQISFETSQSQYNFAHTPAVPDKCKVFLPAGGGVVFQEPKSWFDPANFNVGYMMWFTGDVGVTDVGTSAPELTLSFGAIRKDVCEEINKRLGVTAPGQSTPVENADMLNGVATDFTGSYTPVGDNIGDDVGSIFKGKSVGCATMDGINFAYYHTLIAR